jgi:hypothetical protein
MRKRIKPPFKIADISLVNPKKEVRIEGRLHGAAVTKKKRKKRKRKNLAMNSRKGL